MSELLYTFTFGSDCHQYNAVFASVLDEIVSVVGGAGDFHISMGDWDRTYLDPYESPEVNRGIIDTKFGSDTIWYPVMSNHVSETPDDMTWLRNEYNNGQSGTRTALKNYTNEDGPAGIKETQYTFDWGPVRFVSVNLYANDALDDDDSTIYGEITNGQLKWLNATFKAACAAGKQIIVLGHEPCFNNNTKAGGYCLDRNPKTRNQFCQLMENYGVLAYLNGHSHYYSAFIPNTEVLAADETWDHETVRPPNFPPNETWHIDDSDYGGPDRGDGYAFGVGQIYDDQVVFNIYRNVSGDLETWALSAESPITLPFRSPVIGQRRRNVIMVGD